MFNLKKHEKTAQVAPYEKYLREKNVGPKADDGEPIWEKSLKHWTGNQYTTTEDQMGSDNKHTIADTEDSKQDAEIIEKVLNEAQSYVPHRSDGTWLPVPAIQAVVEKMRQNRQSEYKEDKVQHWSHSYDENAQKGSLPTWSKNVGQHDKIVLNNDPRRFKNMENLPVHWKQPENDKDRSNSNEVKPLVGNITKADIDTAVLNIKVGKALDYDSAIVAILHSADSEKRELSEVEQKAVADLKIARTKAMIKEQS